MSPNEQRAGPLHADQVAFLVERTITILVANPRGASRRDLIGALQLQPAHWPALRSALDRTGLVVAVGRGPGLRYLHTSQAAAEEPAAATPSRAGAREAIERLVREQGEIYSRDAQHATGLSADAVRRILLELVRKGKVACEGHKRSTRYKWQG